MKKEVRRKSSIDSGAIQNDFERFAYIVFHDLREPLRSIRAWADILQKEGDKELSDDSKKALGFILKGADRMEVMFQSLLDYSRAMRVEKVFTRVAVKDLFLRALSAKGISLEKKPSVVTFEGAFPKLHIIEEALNKAVGHLLENALKFREPGKPLKLTIRCEKSKKRDEWIFCIEDNGLGIRSEDHDKLFVPMKRLHAHLSFEGQGMGLCISQKLFERQGGRLWLKSKVGQGTEAYFSLPA